MKILITGATGFVGHQLVNALTEHQLLILSRNPKQAQAKLGAQHQYIDSIFALENLNDIDAVINLAGEPIVGKRWTHEQKQLICDSRWNITSAISQLIKRSEQPPHTFISASAIGYYGRQDDNQLTEDSPPHDEFSHRVCHEWEQLALQAASDKTRVCVTRIGIILGKNGGALAKMLLPFKLGLGGPIGSGKQGFSWIHMSDMVGLLLFLLQHKTASGIFNATAPTPVSQAEFAKKLGHSLHRPTFIPTPTFALRAAMGEMSDLLTHGQFVIPTHALSAGYKFKQPDLLDALKDVVS
ncbi:TIGR01777 family oxidoreductase [Shewanella intestini]|uniref:TIGR01777 family protein n=1 Tax=Shewanella intestini TaxID=2017544 RepID=A0ABS5I5E3_9GAMM|nr:MULTISPECIES: TIGR01777 family oxidoreductase [Shewanella]MBR9729247.1 TIGR01777 family protein [Shewanella intestini]MRG35392.1 TIGR01777 family protein [Shewanella sp. XMDDZSB0408]